MFNRKIQVGLVKSTKSEDNTAPSETFAEKLNTTMFRFKEIACWAAVGVVMYVAADTLRQVTIKTVDHYVK